MPLSDDLGLVDYASLTPDSLTAQCDAAMRECDAAIAAIVATPDRERTFENTLLALEEATDSVALASGRLGFMAYVSASEEIRAAARAADEALDNTVLRSHFVRTCMKRYARSPALRTLRTSQAKAPACSPMNSASTAATVSNCPPNSGSMSANSSMSWLSFRLSSRRTSPNGTMASWSGARTLKGSRMRSSITSRRWTREVRRATGSVLDYPEIQPFMSNSESSTLRRELFEKDQRKGGDKNVQVLERAIALRQEVATILGTTQWAAYRVETRMAKHRETVDAFLADLREKVALKAEADMAQMRDVAMRERGANEVNIWDWRFFNNLQLKTAYRG